MSAGQHRSIAVIALGISFVAVRFCAIPARAQKKTGSWQEQVQELARQRNWTAAMELVDQQIARAPDDMEMRAWRARLLAWSDHLPEAEHDYLQILDAEKRDPDIWAGLSTVYWREGKLQEAQQAIESAESLDPDRADIHTVRGKILAAQGRRTAARLEFREALRLAPTNSEARAALASLRGESKQELRFGQGDDMLSYTSSIHDEFVGLISQWTPCWSTNASGHFYQNYGVQAEKLLASVTHRDLRLGALTLGGAVAHDGAVIPRSEAFFAVDRGWKTSQTSLVRGMEFSYEQHWYWYQSARVLTVNGAWILYLPQDWTFSLGATGARSVFSTTDVEWKPSEIARTEFPLARWGQKRLLGNLLFAVGTEGFAQVNQIGRFASQTYGVGVRFRMTPRQHVSEYVTYQKRTQNRSDIGLGFSYDIHL